ncbi:hypothetical protein NPIL_160001 [Nephila pilipes]|uniref:DUF4817 domain-containing protein n=1 Tax=Nephila pilipes TaxID=299642 RepID=A0A8X6NMM4_NEPPI|nr:hypothetical protein NPIL_160001 [Nephila pilipes]
MACRYFSDKFTDSISLQMATIQEKAICVLWFHESKSIESVQKHFCLEYLKCLCHTQSMDSIKHWYQQLIDTGSEENRIAPGRSSILTEYVDGMRETF